MFLVSAVILNYDNVTLIEKITREELFLPVRNEISRNAFLMGLLDRGANIPANVIYIYLVRRCRDA